MGDRVAVLWQGRARSRSTRPQRLYEPPGEPLRRRVHRLTGDEPRRRRARTRGDDGLVASFGDAPRSASTRRPPARGSPAYVGRRLILGFRPEDLEDASLARGDGDGATLAIVTDIRENVGSEVYIHFDLAVPPVRRAEVARGDRPRRSRAPSPTSARARARSSRACARDRRPRRRGARARRRHAPPLLLRSRERRRPPTPEPGGAHQPPTQPLEQSERLALCGRSPRPRRKSKSQPSLACSTCSRYRAP